VQVAALISATFLFNIHSPRPRYPFVHRGCNESTILHVRPAVIKFSEESAVSLGEVPRHLPPGRGGRRYTDRAAIARFIERTTAAREQPPISSAVPESPAPPIDDRRRSVAAAEEGLRRVGV
jgi:hypothetical protein